MVIKIVVLAFISFIGCSSVAFNHRYYYPRLNSYSGVLLGNSADTDLDAEKTCAPNDQEATRCVIMKLDEFLNLKAEHLKLKTDLRACQRSK